MGLLENHGADHETHQAAIAPSPASPPGENLGRPFFVVGAGRSGTTMLRLMLTGHSNLHVCPETWFIEDLARHLPLRAPLTPSEIERAIALVTHHYRWPDVGLTEADLRALIAGIAQPTLRAILDGIYGSLARSVGKGRIGDKTPVYVRILPVLAELYPEAQFIHLLRDGRDVAMSYIDAGWRHRCYQDADFEWSAAVRAARRFGPAARPGTWLELRYEDLVANPEMTMRRLCAYLGEAFDPAMVTFPDRLDLVPERERGIHPRLTQSITTETVGKWRRVLSPLELFVMEACLHRDLAASGYDLRHAGRLWYPVLALAGALLKAACPLLLVVVPALQRRGLLGARRYL
jgi:hypothetical protein